MTKYIEEFLTHFDDQHLANLQCAAEDGELRYFPPCSCLLHHHQGNYWATKYKGKVNHLAEAAEREFHGLSDIPFHPLTPQGPQDAQRRERILPLIHAEWGRRARPVPVTFEQPAKAEVPVAATRQS